MLLAKSMDVLPEFLDIDRVVKSLTEVYSVDLINVSNPCLYQIQANADVLIPVDSLICDDLRGGEHGLFQIHDP